MTPDRVPRLRRRFPVWLRWSTSAAVVAVLLLVLPASEVLEGLRAAPLHVVPIAVAAYLACHMIGVAKWRLLVNTAGAGLSWRAATQAYYFGLFGNLFLPSIVGGDVVRAGVALRAARPGGGSALILGSLVDRLQDVVALGIVAGTGALLSPRALDPASRRIFVTLLVALGGFVVVAALALRFFPARRLRFGVRRRLVRVRTALRSAARRPGALAVALSLGTLLQIQLVTINWWLGDAVGLDAPFYVWMFVWPLAKLAGLLPVTQGGIGVREAAQAALFAPFGVAAALAVAAGLVFEVVLITGGVVAGGIFLALRRTAKADPVLSERLSHRAPLS